MKPIEISIEGYKVVITKVEDDDQLTYKQALKGMDKESITLPDPCSGDIIYTGMKDWGESPFTVTWTYDDVINGPYTTPVVSSEGSYSFEKTRKDEEGK